MSSLNVQQVPKLRRGFRLQWEPVQDSHVLLYPEGMIKLNDSAAQILQQVDGQRSVLQILDSLQQRFPEACDLDQDVLAFLEVACAQFWLELH